jgi:hypothetical protein
MCLHVIKAGLAPTLCVMLVSTSPQVAQVTACVTAAQGRFMRPSPYDGANATKHREQVHDNVSFSHKQYSLLSVSIIDIPKGV